jgi:serine/threonine protein kinase
MIRFSTQNQQVIDDFWKEIHNMKYQLQLFVDNVRNLRPHPNICNLLGVCTDSQYPLCIITEFVEQGSLKSLLDDFNFKFEIETAVAMLKDIANGMNHLHVTDPISRSEFVLVGKCYSL